MLKRLLFLFLLLSTTTGLLAQENTLDEQFSEVINKSNSYKEFKVIEKEKINTLKSNVLDSVAAFQQNIEILSEENEQQKTTITKLRNELEVTQNNLSESIEKQNGIQIFGFIINKSTYNIFVILMIVIFHLFLFTLLYKFRKSHTLTKSAEKKLLETEDEYESFRQRSLEREQKLRRDLQDEINKNKDA